MAPIKIDAFSNIEFEIPDGKGKNIVIELPPSDCLEPHDIEQILEKVKDINEADPYAQTRVVLEHYNPTKTKREAIAKLVTRQLRQLDEEWGKASGVELGESLQSTDTSTETDESE